jgi:hypothetical protein
MSAASVTTMLKIHCGPQQQTIYAQKPSLFEVPLRFSLATENFSIRAAFAGGPLNSESDDP